VAAAGRASTDLSRSVRSLHHSSNFDEALELFESGRLTEVAARDKVIAAGSHFVSDLLALQEGQLKNTKGLILRCCQSELEIHRVGEQLAAASGEGHMDVSGVDALRTKLASLKEEHEPLVASAAEALEVVTRELHQVLSTGLPLFVRAESIAAQDSHAALNLMAEPLAGATPS